MSESDRQLIRAAVHGDPTAADRLIDEHHQRIYAYHRRLTGDQHEAEDLTQLTFSKAWRSLDTFAGRSTVSAWLHGIAYHVFADWMRKRRLTETASDEWWDSCPDTNSGFATVADRDAARTLWATADRLSDDLRQTVHLHYYQELTLQETATALGIAVSTVKFRINKAIDELKKQLAEPGLKPTEMKL